jgi:beta-barrel assembly-enhancing protease
MNLNLPLVSISRVIAFGLVPAAMLALISVNDEIALGRQAQQQVKAEVPGLADGTVTSYVQSIGRRLAARAPGPKYPYSFTVADYREINAFALPGGPVWVHRGTLSASSNEAQLAGVLAHEVAHVAQRHSADQLTKRLVANGLLGLLGAVLGNDRSARTAQAAAQVLAGGYMLKFSRDDEREADRVGARLLRQAGWDAREMIAFMDTLRREQGRDPSSVEIFLSSHPGPAERAALLRTELRGVSGGRRDSDQFQQIRARLKRLPPARSMKR